jgi:type 1 glutamine amidotransferase
MELNMKNWLVGLSIVLSLMLSGCENSPEKTESPTKTQLKVLIVDGQNNHMVWPKSTRMMKRYLEESGFFTVDVYRTEYLWRSTGYDNYIAKYPLNDDKNYQELKDPKSDPNFKPNFADYDVVISNLGWKTAAWPKETKIAFEKYMREGGGLVVIHAADNAFPNWLEYNKMIGLGGWGNRTEKNGPYVYYNKNNELITDISKGHAGAHGPAHQFPIQLRNTTHPITQGLPEVWLHTKDELYEKLRGPAQNMTILASAYPRNVKNGIERQEPILMTIDYHKGRVFHSTLGHDHNAFEGVGFITTFLRGTEWAATGAVTIPVPEDFPTENNATRRQFID